MSLFLRKNVNKLCLFLRENVNKLSLFLREAGPKATYSKNAGSVDFSATTSAAGGGRKKQKYQASVLPAICKAFGPTFLFGSFMKLIQDFLNFVNPQILK